MSETVFSQSAIAAARSAALSAGVRVGEPVTSTGSVSEAVRQAGRQPDPLPAMLVERILRAAWDCEDERDSREAVEAEVRLAKREIAGLRAMVLDALDVLGGDPAVEQARALVKLDEIRGRIEGDL